MFGRAGGGIAGRCALLLMLVAAGGSLGDAPWWLDAPPLASNGLAPCEAPCARAFHDEEAWDAFWGQVPQELIDRHHEKPNATVPWPLSPQEDALYIYTGTTCTAGCDAHRIERWRMDDGAWVVEVQRVRSCDTTRTDDVEFEETWLAVGHVSTHRQEPTPARIEVEGDRSVCLWAFKVGPWVWGTTLALVAAAGLLVWRRRHD